MENNGVRTSDIDDWLRRNRKSCDASRALVTMPTLPPAPLLLKLLPALTEVRRRSGLVSLDAALVSSRACASPCVQMMASYPVSDVRKGRKM